MFKDVAKTNFVHDPHRPAMSKCHWSCVQTFTALPYKGKVHHLHILSKFSQTGLKAKMGFASSVLFGFVLSLFKEILVLRLQ